MLDSSAIVFLLVLEIEMPLKTASNGVQSQLNLLFLLTIHEDAFSDVMTCYVRCE